MWKLFGPAKLKKFGNLNASVGIERCLTAGTGIRVPTATPTFNFSELEIIVSEENGLCIAGLNKYLWRCMQHACTKVQGLVLWF